VNEWLSLRADRLAAANGLEELDRIVRSTS